MRTDGILADSCGAAATTAFHLLLVERRGRALLAEEQVGDDVEVVAEREVLEDGRDAEFSGLARRVDVTVPPLNADRRHRRGGPRR